MFLFIKKITLLPVFYCLVSPSLGLAMPNEGLSSEMVDNAFKKATASVFPHDKINPNFKVIVAEKRTIELDGWSGGKVNVTILSGLPKNMPSYQDRGAVFESIYADYDFKSKECAVVVVKDNYPRFRERIIKPFLSKLSKFGLEEEDILASVFVHELGHCLESEQIMTTQVTQDFFELSPYSSAVGQYPKVEFEFKVPYIQWRESFADALQALYLSERTKDIDASIDAIVGLRTKNILTDKKHNTINTLERLKGFLSEDVIVFGSWCDMAHAARSADDKNSSKRYFDRCR